MTINPFQKYDVILKLSLNDLFTLLGIISSCVPSVENETIILELHNQIQNKIDEVKSK